MGLFIGLFLMKGLLSLGCLSSDTPFPCKGELVHIQGTALQLYDK